MKKSFQYVLAVAAAAVAAFSFSACGDDVTEVTEIRQEGMAVLEKGEKLSKQACDTTNVGEMLFVMDSSEAFICNGESWQTLKGADGTDGSDGKDGKDGKDGVDGKDGLSCSAKYVIDKAKMLTGVALSCGESIVDTIWNGADGKDGDDGTNCSAKSVKNKAKTRDGIEVTCGETVVDTIWNGEKGDNGEAGKSAYEIAKKNGFKGTEAEWLESMKGPFIQDKRDGKIYKTVKIGNQVWMAENLNYSVNPGKQSWCGGGESGTTNEGDCSVYGRLYTWAAAVGKSEDECGYGHECDLSGAKNEKGEVRGVCPEGWHLPDTTEWNALFDAVGGKDVAGKMLKSASGWNDYDGSNGDGLDAYGFSALPAGYRSDYGYFDNAGYYAYFWSASQSEYDSSSAYYMCLGYYRGNALMYDYDKNYGHSVRCLQNSN